ncbi:hypothetical protein [Bradyrhizobium diazoefficiens]|uniref:hypothetical protein n=1 Tax=Bradyrhizobium diazoefficiens TaxID=1355477 RepID=UPI002B4A46CB|nr:hypothetical protein [Bradyrhizobium diazoefficiens]WRJ68948.1 hypothetical protein T7740_20495 [Bradyrhizobium diazoefficiens]
MAGCQDRLAGTAGEEALGVVETKIREEARGLAGIADADGLGCTVPRHVGPLKEQTPEAVEILHREAVHRSVIAQLLPRSGLTPLAESSELRMCDAMSIGTEHDFLQTRL